MKKLLSIAIFLLSLAGFAQTKVQVIEGEIVRTGIPSKFERPSGEVIWGRYDARTDLHYIDGFRDLVMPEYDPTTQRITNRHYDLNCDCVTYDVIDKTIAELTAEREAVLDAIENDMDIQAMKRLLRILTSDILADPEITAEQISDLTTIYSHWRDSIYYEAGDVVVYETDLYRVISEHTSQSDWLPTVAASLYTVFRPAGQVTDWVQPAGQHDAYRFGERVSFNGSIYESIYGNPNADPPTDYNVWSPTAYPAGWQLIE